MFAYELSTSGPGFIAEPTGLARPVGRVGLAVLIVGQPTSCCILNAGTSALGKGIRTCIGSVVRWV